MKIIVTGSLGNIGKPGLKMARLPEKLAEMLVNMQAAMHSGKALENFHRSNPKMGKVKLADFARKFASVYKQNT